MTQSEPGVLHIFASYCLDAAFGARDRVRGMSAGAM